MESVELCQDAHQRERVEVQKKSGILLPTPSHLSIPLWSFCCHKALSRETLPKKKWASVGSQERAAEQKTNFTVTCTAVPNTPVQSLMSCCKSPLKTVLATVPRAPVSETTSMSHSYPWPQIQSSYEGEIQRSLLPSHCDLQEQSYCHPLPHLNLQAVHHTHPHPPFEVLKWPVERNKPHIN